MVNRYLLTRYLLTMVFSTSLTEELEGVVINKELFHCDSRRQDNLAADDDCCMFINK